jgi:RHS repeat-associated protein
VAENNIRFPGQYHDRATGLYYNQFRYYRPDLGRYLTPDPIGLAGGINLYSYAAQNPINYTDPLGLKAFSCAETLEIIREVGKQNLLEAAWNHRGRGKYDFKYRQMDDTFEVDGRILGADEFGNYIAGYAGYKSGGMFGYNGVRAGGILYDFVDNIRFDILNMFNRPRPESNFDWDEDSSEQVNAGALRGLLEEEGISVGSCECQ